MIKVVDLCKSYPMGKEKLYVLNGVNLNVKKGEFIAVVGQSGCGKSTLMNLIGGLDRAEGGKVFVDGKDINGLKDSEAARYRNQKIGFVFQSFNLEASYTALENVMLPLILAGVPHGKRKSMAMEALKLMGLENRVHHKPSEMSGGERQRVSIARAIVNKPQILLADEPTGNLDSKNGMAVMKLLKELCRENDYTIIMVTHNMEDAQKCDRIIRMKDGTIEGGAA